MLKNQEIQRHAYWKCLIDVAQSIHIKHRCILSKLPVKMHTQISLQWRHMSGHVAKITKKSPAKLLYVQLLVHVNTKQHQSATLVDGHYVTHKELVKRKAFPCHGFTMLTYAGDHFLAFYEFSQKWELRHFNSKYAFTRGFSFASTNICAVSVYWLIRVRCSYNVSFL